MLKKDQNGTFTVVLKAINSTLNFETADYIPIKFVCTEDMKLLFNTLISRSFLEQITKIKGPADSYRIADSEIKVNMI
jgi:hypothetical protein